MLDYATLPAGLALEIKEFCAGVADEKLEHFVRLLELSPIAPPVFENSKVGRAYGCERDWISKAKDAWLHQFDWRACEERINSFPNFTAEVQDSNGVTLELHFVALFSTRKDAVPVAFLHGWPCSFCSFLAMAQLLKDQYGSDVLPYHVIIPSLPGYAFSGSALPDVDFTVEMAADVINSLMVGLGFSSGYLAHGGDLGSIVARILALQYDACKGVHLSMLPVLPGPEGDDEEGARVRRRVVEFMDTEYGFALEQGTKPATIGLMLSTSPLALLCWMGEKFLAWSDEDIPLEKILEAVTLYWMTETMPRALYHNRGMGNIEGNALRSFSMSKALGLLKISNDQLQLPHTKKPCGYSLFAKELVPAPRAWVEQSFHLVSYNQHDCGGHFAAMEQPDLLLADIEEYVAKAWNQTT